MSTSSTKMQGARSRRRTTTNTAVGAALALAAAHCSGAAPSADGPVAPSSSAAAATPALSAEPASTAKRPTYTLASIDRWKRAPAPGFETFTDPDGTVLVHVFESTEVEPAAAITAAIAKLPPRAGVKERSRESAAPEERFSEQLVVTFTSDDGESFRQGAAFEAASGGHVYVFVIEGPTKSVVKRTAEIERIISSLEIEGSPRRMVLAKDRRPLDPAKRDALFEYAARARERSGVPGLAVAIVTPEGVFTRGFGVRALGSRQKVDADTQFMIGSITKSFSTLLMATLVDDGKLRWDEPATEAYPNFRLADAKRTPSIQMQHFFCACTGAARQDMELLFEFAKVTPKQTLDGAAGIALTTDLGETFQYNNQLTAIGGFITGLVAEPRLEPGAAYARALQTRVLDRIGMKSSSLDFVRVKARGNHALPHSIELDGSTSAVPLAGEEFVRPLAPAGALWSTANDMARYLEMQLGHGTMKDGTRVVRRDSLDRTQTAQIATSAEDGYGLGWGVGKRRGLRVVEHSGGTMGFNADVAFFPEIDSGIFVVGNRTPTQLIHELKTRFLELSFGLPEKAEADSVKDLAELNEELSQIAAKLSKQPPPADLVGNYRNDKLGDVVVRSTPKGQGQGQGLVLDAGEWSSRLVLVDPKERADAVMLVDGVLKTSQLLIREVGGKKALLLQAAQSEYLFTRR